MQIFLKTIFVSESSRNDAYEEEEEEKEEEEEESKKYWIINVGLGVWILFLLLFTRTEKIKGNNEQRSASFGREQ